MHHFSSSEAILTRINLFPCLNKTKDRKENEDYLHNHDATVRSPDQTYQGHPATCFCKITVRRNTYCLDICRSLRKAKTCWITVPFVLNVGRFSNSLTTIFGDCVIHILIQRYCDYCQKRSPKNFGIKTKRPL